VAVSRADREAFQRPGRSTTSSQVSVLGRRSGRHTRLCASRRGVAAPAPRSVLDIVARPRSDQRSQMRSQGSDLRPKAESADARHARPVRPRLHPDARRPQGRAPGPLGRLAARPCRPRPALTGAAAGRTAGALSRQHPPTDGSGDTATHPTGGTGTGAQGEDDLPNSSQTPGRPHPGNQGGACPSSF
jgi:hypothetical protein